MKDARARHRQRAAELETRLARSTDQVSQAALIAELERAKADAEAEMLGIQARRARAAGHVAAAARLEAAAARLEAMAASRRTGLHETQGARPASTDRAVVR
jgi:hypothetical protein